MKRLSLIVVAVGVAALLSGCLPSSGSSGPFKGFDACAAPSVSTMGTWKSSSPYTTIGVYIGGANRGCAQPNLTRTWVNTVWGQGWKLLPIWVGPQAPCSSLSGTTRIPGDPLWAFLTGASEGSAAADAANALGLGWFAPIYADMEAYPRGGSCTTAVLDFTDGWVWELNRRGYQAGMYSSLCSGILDQAASLSDPSHKPLNAIWIAAWNNTPNIYGFGSPCALSDSLWNNHRRVHQFVGGHNEQYGGITINIDSNAVDGPTS